MNFWNILKTVSLVALALILGVLWLTDEDQSKQPHPTTSSSSSSSDGSEFNGIK